MCFLYACLVLLTPFLHCDTVDADHVGKGAGGNVCRELIPALSVLLSVQQLGRMQKGSPQGTAQR